VKKYVLSLAWGIKGGRVDISAIWSCDRRVIDQSDGVIRKCLFINALNAVCIQVDTFDILYVSFRAPYQLRILAWNGNNVLLVTPLLLLFCNNNLVMTLQFFMTVTITPGLKLLLKNNLLLVIH